MPSRILGEMADSSAPHVLADARVMRGRAGFPRILDALSDGAAEVHADGLSAGAGRRAGGRDGGLTREALLALRPSNAGDISVWTTRQRMCERFWTLPDVQANNSSTMQIS